MDVKSVYLGSAMMLSDDKFLNYFIDVTRAVQSLKSQENVSTAVINFNNEYKAFLTIIDFFADGTPAQKADQKFFICEKLWRGIKYTLFSNTMFDDEETIAYAKAMQNIYAAIMKDTILVRSNVSNIIETFKKRVDSFNALSADNLRLYSEIGLERFVKRIDTALVNYITLRDVLAQYRGDESRKTISEAKTQLVHASGKLMNTLIVFDDLTGDTDIRDALCKLKDLRTNYLQIIKAAQTDAKNAATEPKPEEKPIDDNKNDNANNNVEGYDDDMAKLIGTLIDGTIGLTSEINGLRGQLSEHAAQKENAQKDDKENNPISTDEKEPQPTEKEEVVNSKEDNNDLKDGGSKE